MAAGIVAAAVGVQVVRADEHMPGFAPHPCMSCCAWMSNGEYLCTGGYECQVPSLGNYPTCACGVLVNSQGQVVGVAGLCLYNSYQ